MYMKWTAGCDRCSTSPRHLQGDAAMSNTGCDAVGQAAADSVSVTLL